MAIEEATYLVPSHPCQDIVVCGPDRTLMHHPQNYIELYLLESLGCLEYEIDM